MQKNAFYQLFKVVPEYILGSFSEIKNISLN